MNRGFPPDRGSPFLRSASGSVTPQPSAARPGAGMRVSLIIALAKAPLSSRLREIVFPPREKMPMENRQAQRARDRPARPGCCSGRIARAHGGIHCVTLTPVPSFGSASEATGQPIAPPGGRGRRRPIAAEAARCPGGLKCLRRSSGRRCRVRFSRNGGSCSTASHLPPRRLDKPHVQPPCRLDAHSRIDIDLRAFSRLRSCHRCSSGACGGSGAAVAQTPDGRGISPARCSARCSCSAHSRRSTALPLGRPSPSRSARASSPGGCWFAAPGPGSGKVVTWAPR